jgi:hypothetical protein
MSQSERFYELLEEMKTTHDAKRHDYASEEDVFANFRTCEQAGIPAWKGCCVRLGDKFSRIMGFAKKEKLKVKDESIKDTLIDMANYAIIALILYEEELEKDRVGRVHEWNVTHSSNATSNTMLHATGVDPKWVSYEWNQKSNLKE